MATISPETLLVLGPPVTPSPRTLVVTQSPLSTPFLSRLEQCLQGSGLELDCVTLSEDNKDLDQVVGREIEYRTVLVLGLPLPQAFRVNSWARDRGVSFLFCQPGLENCAVFADPVEEEGAGRLESSFSRPDNLGVNVGCVEVQEGVQLVTTDREHFLKAGDRVTVGQEDLLVERVLADKEVVVVGPRVMPGQRVGLKWRERGEAENRTLEQVVDGLGHDRDLDPGTRRFLAQQSNSNCGNKVVGQGLPLSAILSCAGMVATSLLILAFKRKGELRNRLEMWPGPAQGDFSGRKVLVVSGATCGRGENLVADMVLNSLTELGVVVTRISQEAGSSSILWDPSDKVQSFHLWSSTELVISCGGPWDQPSLLDSVCQEFSRPLLVLGVSGLMGQVETVVPHLTTNYSLVTDPSDPTPPHCVLKSFPHLIEHCATWAQEKIHNLLVSKPSITVRFCSEHKNSLPSLTGRLASTSPPPTGALVTYKMLSMLGQPSWRRCVELARLKFEKYFCFKALQLRNSFPPSTKTGSGTMFWSWPKLLPTPLTFSEDNKDHIEFVQLLATAFATLGGLQSPPEDTGESLASILFQVKVPRFRASDKQIVTDESVTKEEEQEGENTEALSDLPDLVTRSTVSEKALSPSLLTRLVVLTCHLRCDMYNIPRERGEVVQHMAGQLEACLPSLAHTVTGLGLGEVARVLAGSGVSGSSSGGSQPLNWWVGPGQVLSAPSPAPAVTLLPNGVGVTMWSRLEVVGSPTTTLQQFLDLVLAQHGLQVTMVVQESRMVYVPFMPGHKARLPKLMSKLVKNPNNASSVTLALTASGGEGDEEDITVPPVLYHF